MTMTKSEFVTKWNSDSEGGGITYDDVANCAMAWGISSQPKTENINKITEQVLKMADVQYGE